MVRITNHTDGHEVETDSIGLYIDSTKELSFEELSTGLTDVEEIIEFLDLTTEEQEKLEAIAYFNGYGYHKTVSDLQSEAENMTLYFFEGCQSLYTVAHHLMFDANSDEELLYTILGCNKESYEQLGSYINTDALASTIDTEHSYFTGTSGTWLKLN